MIVQAACRVSIDRVEDIQIIPLHRHGDMWEILKAFGFKPHKGYKILEEGFIDDRGNFFNRKSAMKHARACGQIISCNREELFSEDIY